MWIALPVGLGSVLLMIVGFVWAARREVIDRAHAVAGLKVSPVGKAKSGELAAFSARLHSETSLVDPVTHERTVFWEASIARDHDILWSNRSTSEVTTDDGSGSAKLTLESAELAIDSVEIETVYDEPSERMRKLLGEREIPEPRKGSRWSLTHSAIAQDEELTIVGVPRSGTNGLELSAARDLLIVTRESLATLAEREGSDVRSMQIMLRAAGAVGAACIAVGAAMAIWH